MSSRSKLKLSSVQKKNTASCRGKKGRPSWNDTLTDQEVYRATSEDLKQRKLSHQSKFADAAKEELKTKKLNRRYECEGNYSSCDEEFLRSEFDSILKASDKVLESAKDLIKGNSTVNVLEAQKSKLSSGTYSRSSNLKKIPQEYLVSNINRNIENVKTSDEPEQYNFADMLSVLNKVRCKVFSQKGEEKIIIKTSEEDNKPAGNRVLSGFTSQLLEVIDELSNQNLAFKTELDEERQQRKKLETEFVTQKVILNELTAELIQVQSQLKFLTDDKSNENAIRSQHDLPSQHQLVRHPAQSSRSKVSYSEQLHDYITSKNNQTLTANNFNPSVANSSSDMIKNTIHLKDVINSPTNADLSGCALSLGEPRQSL